jgi:hypothetical protein
MNDELYSISKPVFFINSESCLHGEIRTTMKIAAIGEASAAATVLVMSPF